MDQSPVKQVFYLSDMQMHMLFQSCKRPTAEFILTSCLLPAKARADLSLQSALSKVLFAFEWLLIHPQKTSLTQGLFSGGMLGRC